MPMISFVMVCAGGSNHAGFRPMGTYARFYDVVRRVPRGRVATYGQVASEAGTFGHARQVGYALAACPDDADIPWHRIVNARGEVSRRSGDRAFERIQRVLLEGEGVSFDDRGRIDLGRFGWNPDDEDQGPPRDRKDSSAARK